MKLKLHFVAASYFKLFVESLNNFIQYKKKSAKERKLH